MCIPVTYVARDQNGVTTWLRCTDPVDKHFKDLTASEMISLIETGEWTFFATDVAGNRAEVHVVHAATGPYLATIRDGVITNNLDQLPTFQPQEHTNWPIGLPWPCAGMPRRTPPVPHTDSVTVRMHRRGGGQPVTNSLVTPNDAGEYEVPGWTYDHVPIYVELRIDVGFFNTFEVYLYKNPGDPDYKPEYRANHTSEAPGNSELRYEYDFDPTLSPPFPRVVPYIVRIWFSPNEENKQRIPVFVHNIHPGSKDLCARPKHITPLTLRLPKKVATIARHVFFLATNGHVHELSMATSSGPWQHRDLNVDTGAPSAVPGNTLTAYVEPSWRHVLYLAGGGVQELYMATSGGPWQHNDLSAAGGAPFATPGSALTSYWEPSSRHVLYLAGGGVQELYMATSGGPWQHNDLSIATGAPPAAPTSALTSYWEPTRRHVLYLSGEGHVHELYMATSGGPWQHNDLSIATGAPPAAPTSALTSYWEPTRRHVLYLATNGHVYELSMATSGGPWEHHDLTAATGAYVAAPGSGLTSYWEPTRRHVLYLATNGHVYELSMATSGGPWEHHDLTAATGAYVAALDSPLASYADPARRHVLYLATNGHVYELSMATSGGPWEHHDLTAATGAPPAAPGTALSAYVDISG